MIARERVLTAVEIEEAISAQRVQIGELRRRLPDLDDAIQATQTLLGEAEERLAAQSSEVVQTRLAAGNRLSFGPPQRTVLWTDGSGTRQLTGPAAPNTPQGKAEHARRLYDALEAEIQPIRGALVSLERERADCAKVIGLRLGEIDQLDRQRQQIQAEEAAHTALVGRLGWRDRLTAILRKLGGPA